MWIFPGGGFSIGGGGNGNPTMPSPTGFLGGIKNAIGQGIQQHQGQFGHNDHLNINQGQTHNGNGQFGFGLQNQGAGNGFVHNQQGVPGKNVNYD